MGRSGLRIEKGLNASGLIGERLLNSPDNPANNTFAQKAWQPCDNPALEVVKKGRPVAGRPSDVSLAIGEMLQPDGQALIPVPIEGTSTYGRKYLITGDILSKSVSSKNPSRVFMDDE